MDTHLQALSSGTAPVSDDEIGALRGMLQGCAQEFCPAVFTPSEPITHRSNLRADNLRLNDCRQLFAFAQRQAEISGAAQSSRSISSTPVSETTLDPSSATSFIRHISFSIAPTPQRSFTLTDNCETPTALRALVFESKRPASSATTILVVADSAGAERSRVDRGTLRRCRDLLKVGLGLNT